MNISNFVFNELLKGDVQAFIESKDNITVYMRFKQYQMDTATSTLLDLLNKMIQEGVFTNQEVKDFLNSKLSNGHLTNLFRYHFAESGLETEEEFIERINSLANRPKPHLFSVEIPADINCNYISDEIYNLVDESSAKLVSLSYEKNEENLITTVKFLIVRGILDNGNRSHLYIVTEIDYINSIVIIRNKNIAKSENSKYSAKNTFKNMKEIVNEKFALTTINKRAEDSLILFHMASDLVNPVLNPYLVKIESILDNKISLFIDDIEKEVGIESSEVGKNIIVSNIKYHLIAEMIAKDYGKLDENKLKANFGVNGYIRQINFLDESQAEGKAKPETAEESILETSVFYDFKARLDDCQTVEDLTIYWLDFMEKVDESTNITTYEKAGVSFHIEEGYLNIVLKKLLHGEEFVQHVLRKIDEYS